MKYLENQSTKLIYKHFFLINNYFEKFDNSWIDYFSVVLSCLSIVYGMVSFNVHTLYWETPKFMNIIKIFVADFFYNINSAFLPIYKCAYCIQSFIYYVAGTNIYIIPFLYIDQTTLSLLFVDSSS